MHTDGSGQLEQEQMPRRITVFSTPSNKAAALMKMAITFESTCQSLPTYLQQRFMNHGYFSMATARVTQKELLITPLSAMKL
jgi:hypothetical protein